MLKRGQIRPRAQLGQDLWILKQTQEKREGYFVEVGAANGLKLSNTFWLEHEFDWQGLCVEPNPNYAEELAAYRQCQISHACVGPTTGEHTFFVLADEYSSMAEFAESDLHADTRSQRTSGSIELITTSLNDLLAHHAVPPHFDYLSIDTEGSEFAILNAFDFSTWTIDYITVEHNYTPQREQLHALLTSVGYQRTVEREWDDWYTRTVLLKQND